MKKNTHPNQFKCTFKCACGATFEAMSNKEEQMLEVCSECHPFYTGAQANRKRTGKVEQFNKKYNLNQNN